MAEISKEQIRLICRSVELAIGQSVQTPKDFENLSQQIFIRTGHMLSRNTLRRIWGNMNDGTNPRSTTLLILVRFLGYNSIESFLKATSNGENEPQSGFVMTRRLSVSVDLNVGDKIRLTWLPDRVCDIEYTGSLCFKVIASSQTRLQPGDTFQCIMIIEGEPLYLDQLQKQCDRVMADRIRETMLKEWQQWSKQVTGRMELLFRRENDVDFTKHKNMPPKVKF